MTTRKANQYPKPVDVIGAGNALANEAINQHLCAFYPCAEPPLASLCSQRRRS
jgi:hypothetical protein